MTNCCNLPYPRVTSVESTIIPVSLRTIQLMKVNSWNMGLFTLRFMVLSMYHNYQLSLLFAL